MSHVLSGKRPASADTRQRVLEAVERLDYRPSALARSLVWRRSLILGLVIPDISNPYFPEFARGAEDRVRAAGYTLALGNSAYDPAREGAYLDLLRDGQLAGAIFCLSSDESPTRQRLLQEARGGLPVVLVHRPIPGLVTVSADNPRGGELAAHHLLKLGHTRIGIVGARPLDEGLEDRESGFRVAVAGSGSSTISVPAAYGSPDIAGGRTAALRLLSQRPDLTAVFALNDLLALGVVEAAQSLGRDVPRDLSVIGFDDIPFARLASPALTTVAQPIRKVGERAAELLLELLLPVESRRAAAGTRGVVLSSELVVRGSTAPAPVPTAA